MRISARSVVWSFSLLVVFMAAVAPSGTCEAQTGLRYYSLPPCRVVDTRCATGAATQLCPLLDVPNGLPALIGNGAPRSFKMRTNCGVAANAQAVSLNATVLPQTPIVGNFFLTLWPSGGSQPVVSTLNFTQADAAIANGAIVPVSLNVNDITAYVATFDTAHLILDVTGYFAP